MKQMEKYSFLRSKNCKKRWNVLFTILRIKISHLQFSSIILLNIEH